MFPGIPKELIEKMKDVETIMEFEQTGNTIKEKLTVGEKVTNEVYTLGQESEFNTWNNDKVNVRTCFSCCKGKQRRNS